MSLTLTRVGLAVLQDAGRPGFEDLGVPRSGAFDPQAYQLACALLDQPGAATIEILAGTLSADLDVDTQLAVVGDAAVWCNGAQWVTGTVFGVRAGDRLEISAAGRGPVYLAVRGLHADRVLGSVSCDTMSGIGPTRLAVGDSLAVQPDDAGDALVGRFLAVPARVPATVTWLRAVPGPHLPLPEEEFRVAGIARSGVRLRPASERAGTAVATLPSLPVCPGAIQVTPSGETIVLGPDSGVTGGYPLAGVMVAEDFALLARLRPGDRVRLVDAADQPGAQVAPPLVDPRLVSC